MQHKYEYCICTGTRNSRVRHENVNPTKNFSSHREPTAGQRSMSETEHWPRSWIWVKGTSEERLATNHDQPSVKRNFLQPLGHSAAAQKLYETQLGGRAAHSPCNTFSGWWSVQQLDCWGWNSAPRGCSFPLLPFLWRRAVMLKHSNQTGAVCLIAHTDNDERIDRYQVNTHIYTGIYP